MRIRIARWAMGALALSAGTACAQTTPATQPGRLGTITVTEDLDLSREQIAPALGATTYTLGLNQIQATPQGENATFQQVLLRMPGVVPDSFGQEHVRGEHGNLTYRVNGVILPEGLNGFAQELDTRLINSVTLIDGTLPAQFGFRTAGIVDVTAKSGSTLESNQLSLYAGGQGTINPSVQVGGTDGKWDYFVTASYRQDDLGIENPTSSATALHDQTQQTRTFIYLSHHIDDTSRLSILLNGAYSNFQIPDQRGLPQAFTFTGHPTADSGAVDENQNEQQYYAVVSYQRSSIDSSVQLSAFSQYGQIHFTPDRVGDPIFQGVAGEVLNRFQTNGLQLDASWIADARHTIRGGALVSYEVEWLDTNSAVFTTDAMGNQTSFTPEHISDQTHNHALTSGIYLQDEWKISPSVTLNYGARYDRFDANFDHEDQLSPRVNLVWKIDDATTFHGGYARYFVPPPVQNVPASTLAKFTDTTNAPANTGDDPPRVERSNYFDAGISHQITKAWQINVDGFYKSAKQLVDLGQFGSAVILSPYNYAHGTVCGTEVSSTYKKDDLSLFANFSWVLTRAHDITSQQFEFDPGELAYIKNHNIRLDHQSEYTVSAGASYHLTHDDLVYLDVLYGSGLRAGFANTMHESPYYPVNLGWEHVFHPNAGGNDTVTIRVDLVNALDESYELRNGSGLGVNAAQWGQRRTLYAGVTYGF